MIRVVAKNYIRRESMAVVMPLIRELIEETRKEEGCGEYGIYADTRDETCLVFLEEWASPEALEAHSRSEHYVRIVPQIKSHTYKEGELSVLRPC